MRSLTWMALLLAGVGCGDAIPGSAPPIADVTFSEAVAVPLIPTGGTDGDAFGSAVAVMSDAVLVGAPGDSAGASASGAVHIFRFDEQEWIAHTKLKSLAPEPDGRIGASLAAAETRILVGAPQRDAHVGGALVLTEGDGFRQEWMMPPTPTAGAFFGHAVSLDGSTALVGEPFVGIPQPGAVAVFDRVGQGWQHTQSLVGGDATQNFGRAVAISGDLAIIGTSDAAYGWIRSAQGWSEHGRLVPSAPTAALGTAVALDADTAAVTSLPENAGGAVFVFVRRGNAWLQEAHLSAPQSRVDDGFGQSLAVQGGVLVVGAPGLGAAYVYQRESHDWSLQVELTPPETVPGFGSGVAIDGTVAAVAAVTESSGAAFVFRGR